MPIYYRVGPDASAEDRAAMTTTITVTVLLLVAVAFAVFYFAVMVPGQTAEPAVIERSTVVHDQAAPSTTIVNTPAPTVVNPAPTQGAQGAAGAPGAPGAAGATGQAGAPGRDAPPADPGN